MFGWLKNFLGILPEETESENGPDSRYGGWDDFVAVKKEFPESEYKWIPVISAEDAQSIIAIQAFTTGAPTFGEVRFFSDGNGVALIKKPQKSKIEVEIEVNGAINKEVVIEPVDESVEDSHQKIEEMAYMLWEKAGRPDGESWKFWFEAEKVHKRRNLTDLNNILDELIGERLEQEIAEANDP